MRLIKLVGIFCLCLTIVSLNAQRLGTDYDAKWTIVDSLLMQRGLVKTALAQVEKIDAIARQENNRAQELKALIYQVLIPGSYAEGADTAGMRLLEVRVKTAGQPARSILESLLARTYRDYLRRNSNHLENRTVAAGSGGADVTNWTIEDFHRRIRELYLQSTIDEALLEHTGLREWEPVLIPGNSRKLRPTLFDLLAHEALGYFGSPEASLNEPGDNFSIDDTVVFGGAQVFADHNFGAADSASPHYQALLLYQRLLRLHLRDARPDALIDADLDRLDFAKTYTGADDKEDQYLQALSRLTEKWLDDPGAAQAWYLLANSYLDRARNSAVASGGKADSAWADGAIRAKAICERVLRGADSSEGKMNCRILLRDIVEPTLNLQVEHFNVPNKPFRCLVTWSNTNKIYLRLVKIGGSQFLDEAKLNDRRHDWTKAPVYQSMVQRVPDDGDYLRHSTEIAVGSLPPGNYALLSSTDSSWNIHTGHVLEHHICVTSVAWLVEGLDYILVDRTTGQPLNDTRIQSWERVFNTDDRGYQVLKKNVCHTDLHGHFLATKLEGYGREFFEFIRPGEDIYTEDLNGPYGPSGVDEIENDKEVYEQKNMRVFFFLDRGIYRPGQTVFFKGISITRDFQTGQMKPVTGRSAWIILLNANRESIDSLRLTTDSFGSYHGSFRLPDHGLNGLFAIEDTVGETSSQQFSVEEYKRPRFFVQFDPVKSGYRVGDRVELKGSAKAYAGNNLDGATVKYRIRRLPRYPDWMWRYRRWYQSRGAQEIAHGQLKTDGGGNFRLVFDALPDRGIPVASDPRFDYSIDADVTDINGETRSASTTVVAGYAMFDVALRLADNQVMPADSLKRIAVTVSNLSGEPIPAVAHVAAYPLQAPNRLIRERLWNEMPDRWVLSEKTFLDSFPNDCYRDELNKEKWPQGTAAWQATDSAGGKGLAVQLKPGWWMIEATTTDGNGQVAKDRRYIQLVDDGTGAPTNPQYQWGDPAVTRVNGLPGSTVRVQTGSSTKDLFLVRQIERPDRIQNVFRKDELSGTDSIRFHYLTASDGNLVETRLLGESDRGGIGIADAFVKDNRMYVHRTLVQVPWDNKALQVRYSSYRDKTEPGSGEKWGVQIGGYRGAGVAAQVLAAMYDASLDQFASNSWDKPDIYPSLDEVTRWQIKEGFLASQSYTLFDFFQAGPARVKEYDQLMGVESRGFRGQYLALRGYYDADVKMKFAAPQVANASPLTYSVSGNMYVHSGIAMFTTPRIVKDEEDKSETTTSVVMAAPIQVRKNLQETAFFFPDLRTDSAGGVSFSFTMPESLTQWKWMTLAHTRDLAFGYSEKMIVTQKQLMVQPNAPRFLREGDKINFSVKVVNMTDSEMTGQLGLALTDPTTGETADGWFVNRQPNQYFTVAARGSSVVEFPLDIPFQYNRPVSYRIVAEAGAYSDGEEAILPVVSNRMLVTETLPLNMPGDGVRNFKFEKLLQSGSSETLSQHALTVEFTANPAWYAVEALPYLMEYPYECAEQTFDRLYANAVASRIVSGSPRIAQVFEHWKTADTSALLSNLEKNPELKSVLLEETPWVMEGKTETQQKRNIALLFDLTRVAAQLGSTVDRLSELQAADGGFPWFKGGLDDRFVTQYILTGLGRIERMHALSPALAEKVRKIVKAGLEFVDREIVADYQRALNVKDGVHSIAPFAAQYLYMRSLFNDYGISGTALPAVSFYRKLAQQEWVKASKYIQGMLALALDRTGDVQTARSILASLRETAIRDPERGMYWKGMEGGYYWYQAPVETSALLIEAFREIGHDTAADRGLKTWLLRQKQTHRWATTKATADACYALLSGNEDWLDQQRDVKVQLGEKTADLWGGEAGTGYAKKIFDGPFINPGMGDIKVTMTSAKGGGSPAWGAVYWQYFDQLDRITAAGGSSAGAGQAALRVSKRLFVQRNTDRGPVLDTIPDNGTLRVGDRVVARITLRSDRDVEFVHLKDMRGACFEPLNVLSGFEWQGGLGYYETTKDASTEFFFSWVPKGVYVFDYSMVVGQTGEFSNGVTSVECLYAPEFANHTEGIRINAEGGQ